MEENRNFFEEISKRLLLQFKPFNHLYVLVLFFFITLIGGFGIWYTMIVEREKPDYFSAVSFTIFQFCSAVITTSLIDIYTNEKIVHKKSFYIYSLALFILLAGFFYFSCTINNVSFMVGSCVCLIITLLIWHLANCDNERFNEGTFNGQIRQQAREIHGNDWENE